MQEIGVVVVGAGAAGLMCAIEAAKRGRRVAVLEKSNKPGKKILMSGGGRCNFTNYDVTPPNYISGNPHFCKSALKRYTQWDFIAMVDRYKVAYHEKSEGQLFCDNKSKDILDILLSECEKHGVTLHLNTTVNDIKSLDNTHVNRYRLETSMGELSCESLVVASGGLSIPTMGSSPFGYQVAEQFGLNVLPTRAGLVPFTLHLEDKEKLSELSGVSVSCNVKSQCSEFFGDMLITHRGLSGPAILNISSYWNPGEAIIIDLLPGIDLCEVLKKQQREHPNILLKTTLVTCLPKRLVALLVPEHLLQKTLAACSYQIFSELEMILKQWVVKPNGTEGYRTAEVTLGGVDCDSISSKTMEVMSMPGLYFIGEVLDVTGWLGGFNFQWAWSSGWAAGQVV